MTAVTTETKPIRYSASEEAFALFLFQGIDQGEAYRRAYPNWKCASSNALYVQASRKAAHPKIRLRIKELRQKVEDASVSTVLERRQRLTTYQRANLLDFVSEDGEVRLSKDIPGHEAIREIAIETRYNAIGNPTIKKRIKLQDPVAAIQEHNRMERIGTPDNAFQQGEKPQINIFVLSGETKDILSNLGSRLLKDGK